MNHYLLIYDRAAGRLLEEPREFGEQEVRRAREERFRLELVHRLNRDIEVIVIDAPSLDAVRQTHGRYFKSESEILRG